MEEIQKIALLLMKNEIPFTYNISSLSLGETDTGYYGTRDTLIKWNYYQDNKYTVDNALKGYPQCDSFDSAEEVLDFIKQNLI